MWGSLGPSVYVRPTGGPAASSYLTGSLQCRPHQSRETAHETTQWKGLQEGRNVCALFIVSLWGRKAVSQLCLGVGLEECTQKAVRSLGFALLKLPCLLWLITSQCLDKHQLPRTKTLPVVSRYEWQRPERPKRPGNGGMESTRGWRGRRQRCAALCLERLGSWWSQE